MGNPSVLKLLFPVLLITTGTTWFAEIVMKLILPTLPSSAAYVDSLHMSILLFGSLIFVIAGLMLAKNYTDKLCQPNNLSFEELSKTKKDKLISKTKLVICGLSRITETVEINGKTEQRNIKLEVLKDHINHMFKNNHVDALCGELKYLNTDLKKGFSWQQQIRLFKEMSTYHKSFTVSVVASKESYEQLSAFQTLIDEFNTAFKTQIKLSIPEKAIDFTQVNEVHKAINDIIKLWSIKHLSSYVMIDVTAGQKTVSMSGVLASVADKRNYTAYVDTQMPFKIRVQNIENQHQAELKAI